MRRPGGLMSWRYLSPWARRDSRITTHRRLWLASRRRGWLPVWLVLEIARWVLWRTIRLPRIARSLPHADNGALKIARRWSIPPYEVARHGLAEREEVTLSLIYDIETAAFHRLRNGDTPQVEHDTRLLADKVQTSAACADARIPVAPIVAVIPRGSRITLQAQFVDLTSCYCKARNGYGARRAFSAWRTVSGMAGSMAEGVPLATDAQVEAAWRQLLAGDDALVQPLLATHPAFAPMAATGDLVTLRFITERTDRGFAPFHAMLEIPTDIAGMRRTAVIPTDVATGDLLPWPLTAAYVAGAADLAERVRDRAREVTGIPDFDRIRGWSLAAHALVPSLWAVAWDWGLTPEGPLLLEGNAGFSLAMPQILRDDPMALWGGRDRADASD